MHVEYLYDFSFDVRMKNSLRITSEEEILDETSKIKKVWECGDSFFWLGC